MARVSPEGELIWALHLLESTGTGLAKHLMTTPAEELLVAGSLGAQAQVRPGTPGAVTLQAEGVNGQWWGVFDADADVTHAHLIEGIEAPYGSHENVNITSMHASPDGTIYFEGSFDQGIVFNVGEPDEHTLTTGNDGEHWFAAWGPDGDFRWVRLEEDHRVLRIDATDGALRVFYSQVVPHVWGSCTPYETTITPFVDPITKLVQPVQAVVTYDAITGDLAANPNATTYPPALTTWTADQTMAFLHTSSDDTVIAGREVPSYTGVLLAIDEDFLPRQPIRVETEGFDVSVAADVIRADDQQVVIASAMNKPLGFTTQWECGPALDLPPYVPTGSSDSHTVFYTFTPDLEPQCVGTFGMSGSDVDALIDQEGGLVFTSAMTQPYTFGAGQPNEVTITPDQGDALLVRFAPP
jgi:hypothetical protein